jgi:hypothetical protein
VGVGVDVGVGVGGVPVGVAVGSTQLFDTSTLRQPNEVSHSSIVQNLPSSQFCDSHVGEHPCAQLGGSQASGNSTTPFPQAGHGVRHPLSPAIVHSSAASRMGDGMIVVIRGGCVVG